MLVRGMSTKSPTSAAEGIAAVAGAAATGWAAGWGAAVALDKSCARILPPGPDP